MYTIQVAKAHSVIQIDFGSYPSRLPIIVFDGASLRLRERWLRLVQYGHSYVIAVDVPRLAILRHMSRRKVEAVVRHDLYSEVVQADGLLEIAATACSFDEHFFGEIIIVEVTAHRLSIVQLDLDLEWLPELLVVDAMALFIPMRVNKLHIAIEAAKLCQELGLV